MNVLFCRKLFYVDTRPGSDLITWWCNCATIRSTLLRENLRPTSTHANTHACARTHTHAQLPYQVTYGARHSYFGISLFLNRPSTRTGPFCTLIINQTLWRRPSGENERAVGRPKLNQSMHKLFLNSFIKYRINLGPNILRIHFLQWEAPFCSLLFLHLLSVVLLHTTLSLEILPRHATLKNLIFIKASKLKCLHWFLFFPAEFVRLKKPTCLYQRTSRSQCPVKASFKHPVAIICYSTLCDLPHKMGFKLDLTLKFSPW